jgi:hypothetical protein
MDRQGIINRARQDAIEKQAKQIKDLEFDKVLLQGTITVLEGTILVLNEKIRIYEKIMQPKD